MKIDSYENVVLHTTIQEHILKDTNFRPALEQLGNFPQHLPNLKFKSFVIRRNLSTFYMKASHFDIILGVANVPIIQFTFKGTKRKLFNLLCEGKCSNKYFGTWKCMSNKKTF